MRIKLSTGKEIYANGGFIGLNEKDQVSGGYDQLFETLKEWDEDDDPEDDWLLTRADRYALADMMIKRWMNFRERCG